MCVVWGGNDDSVDALAHFFVHLAEVEELFGLGEFLGFGFEVAFVDVAKSNHIADVPALIDIARTLATNANTRDAQLIER